MKIYKRAIPIITAISAAVLVSCGSGGAIISPPIENIDSTPLKSLDLTETEKENWKDYDLSTDTIPGMSINRAYEEIIKNKKGKTVVVAVIDSGVDVGHEDLDDVIWVNKDEIPGNGKDDDNNGYIDDIHGWNFLGDVTKENLEYERILRDRANLPADMVAKAQKEFDKKKAKAQMENPSYNQILQQVNTYDPILIKATGKDEYIKEDVAKIDSQVEEVQKAKAFANFLFSQGVSSMVEARKELTKLIDGNNALLDGSALTTNYREDILGDNPYKWDTPVYGNNKYSGPDPEMEGAMHGTHVAGIIAAERNNGMGANGVANNAKIMVLRAVPDGDEYDKDIAMAIRYAADNGAKVINGSFGKYHSTHPEWVWDALKYAASKDVLFVNAAGNEALSTDETQVFPQDQELAGPEVSDNFITVGALNYEYGSDLVANFSNYGKSSVDVFAPGAQIYSTAPNNEYITIGGTSMAAPGVAGIAAMIRSYYPKLTAGKVKQVLKDSGVPTAARVKVGGEETKPFSELSSSGKMVNLYNALILASKM
ncbi:MAG: S8 family peptidase [Nonlabens sp.]